MREILEDVADNHVLLEGDWEGVTFKDRDEIAPFTCHLERGHEHLLDVDGKLVGPQKSLYSNSYLYPFAKALQKVAEIVRIEWAEDMPVKCSAFLPFQIELEFWLAPRIESD